MTLLINNIAKILIKGNVGAINLVHFAKKNALVTKLEMNAIRSKFIFLSFQLKIRNPNMPNKNTGAPSTYGNIFSNWNMIGVVSINCFV